MSDTEEKTVRERGPRTWPGGQVLRLDLRSLALARIAYGVLLFSDTVVRWTDVRSHYSDFGVLPRAQLLELGWNQHWFSIHMASGSVGWMSALFALQTLCALAVLVGWHTRVNTFLSWFLLISLHSRNPMVLNGGDIYIRVFLFWMLFLPWGNRWSWDSLKGSGDHRGWMPAIQGSSVKSTAAVALAVQVASVYWFAALPKTDPSWTANYTATTLALRLDQFITPTGIFFREHFAAYLATLTFLVIFWEFYGPFLLFFPFDRGQTRTLAVFGFCALHIGFGTMMELGFFAWVGTLTPLALLPAWFWDRPLGKLSRWLDGKLGVGAVEEERTLPVFMEVLYFLLMLYCFAWNMNNENVSPRWFRMPARLYSIGHALRLDQRWNMFSPGPLTEDGWYVIEGKFRDGRTLDLFTDGKPVTWDKPADVAHTYKNQRWRKYLMNLWLAENEKYRLPYGQYLCRLWNKRGRGPDELTGFEIIYMLEVTNPDGTEKAPEKRVIWKHWCYDPPPEDTAKKLLRKSENSNSKTDGT